MEEKQKTQAELSEQGSEVKGKRKPVLIWVVAAVAAVALAVIVGVLVHINSPAYRANQALQLGEHYLEELDYERAVAEFKRALELDPGNMEIAAAISAHEEEFLSLAKNYGEAGNYGMERQTALLVLMVDDENERADELLTDAAIQELLEQANRDFEDAHYEDAKDKYDKAVELGAEESKVNPNLPVCNAYLELSDLCKASQWEKVLNYVDSEKFDVIADQMNIANPLFISEKVPIVVGKKDGSYYVISGELTEGNPSEEAVGVISSANTYAIYTGNWFDYMPNGEGKLRIWYKNEDIYAKNTYIGTFANGMLDGAAVLKSFVDRRERAFDIMVSVGKVSVFTTDEDGNVWICDEVDYGTYVVEGITEENGMIAGYDAGVPGFGGSDSKLSVSYLSLDKEPPVLTCSLNIGDRYRDYTPGEVITGVVAAIDNLDGNLTHEIQYTKTWGERLGRDPLVYQVTEEYSATDAAGNKGTLTITYHCFMNCDEYWYEVISIE